MTGCPGPALPAAGHRGGVGRRPLPLCPAVGESQLGRAEGRGPSLRLAVRPPQQGVHAVPLGGEGPAEVPAGGTGGEPVRTRVLQVSGALPARRRLSSPPKVKAFRGFSLCTMSLSSFVT